MRRHMILFLLPALLGGAGVLPAGAAPDLAFDTSWIEEDCGSDLSCSEQTATMRLAAGGRLRWRLAAGGVRALAPAGLARTLAGPVPIDRGQVQRRAGGGTSGGGSGAKGSHAMESTSSLASPSIEAGDGVWITGFDDVDLGLDARVAGGGSRLFAVDLEADVKAPTASEEKGLGTGEWDGRIGVSAERRFWSFTLFGGGGWSRIGDPEWAELKDTADAFAGLETEPLGAGLRWSAWLWARGEIVEGAGANGVFSIACRSERAAAWRVAIRTGLTSASERFGISLGYAWEAGGRARRRGGQGS